MPRKKKTEEVLNTEIMPKIIQGSHSTITEYRDGRVEMTWDWDKLNKEINDAIQLLTNQTGETPSTGRKEQTKSKKGKKNEMV